MNQTPNYNLSQWEATDRVQRTDFNADNAKIDAAIKAADTLARSKADASALTALSQTAANHTAALAGKGNCQIYTTSYTGNGQFGIDHPVSVSLPGRPLAVFVATPSMGSFLAMIYNGNAVNVGNNSYPTYVTWGSRSISWYSDNASVQFNSHSVNYSVVALLAKN